MDNVGIGCGRVMWVRRGMSWRVVWMWRRMSWRVVRMRRRMSWRVVRMWRRMSWRVVRMRRRKKGFLMGRRSMMGVTWVDVVYLVQCM
jgi:hypothetical protein